MNNWKPIVKCLIENSGEQYTINGLSKKLKLNYRITYTEVKALENEGLIEVRKAGNSSLCRLTGKFNEKVFAVETGRMENLLQNKDLKLIYQRLNKINEQFILLLFGSFAKGNQGKNSDFDLLLISQDPKQVQHDLDLLPQKIHLTHITYSEFIRMLKSKDFSVVSEAVKLNIILFGIEDYYRMVQNAR